MICVLFAKMDKVFGKKILTKWKKILQSEGILSVRNVETMKICVTNCLQIW